MNGGSTKVTKDNFILAESDKYFFEQQEKSGINQFTHDRQLLTMDTQTVVRQNRDTLYSKSIWDAEGGVTFELPILNSYQTLQIIDGQHVWVIARTQVASNSPADIKAGNAKQDMIKGTSNFANPYIPKGFDQFDRENVRLSLEADVLKLDFTKAMGAPEGKPLRPNRI